MNVEGKNILVLGLGKSGMAAAAFLADRGARVTASDAKGPGALTPSLKDLEARENVTLALGRPQTPDLLNPEVDLVVKSPGVPPHIPPLVEARKRKIPVLSEIEVAYAFIKAPIIGITGTNGKTTTTTLLGEILKGAGERVHVGGNIGTPLLDLVAKCRPGDLLVTELSSFQLEYIRDFRPHISVFLNISADHLDHHGTFEAYLQAKANIFLNQREEDFAVLNLDDPALKALEGGIKARIVPFSSRKSLGEGVFVEGGKIIIAAGGPCQTVLPVDDLALPGRHNLENSLAAVAAAHCRGVAPGVMAKTLSSFAGVEHRMEFVGEVKGIAFVNDSKGTNPDAAIMALNSYKEPIVLIAGGKDKGAVFEELADAIQNRVSHLVLLGETREKIARACREAGFSAYTLAGSLEEAVLKAYRRAKPGDIVLLSPACASWDMFSSFEERGNQFKSLIESLGGKEKDEKTGEKRP